MNPGTLTRWADSVCRICYLSGIALFVLGLSGTLLDWPRGFTLAGLFPYLIGIVITMVVSQIVLAACLILKIRRRRRELARCPECRTVGGAHKIRCSHNPAGPPVSAPMDSCPTFPVPAQDPPVRAPRLRPPPPPPPTPRVVHRPAPRMARHTPSTDLAAMYWAAAADTGTGAQSSCTESSSSSGWSSSSDSGPSCSDSGSSASSWGGGGGCGGG